MSLDFRLLLAFAVAPIFIVGYAFFIGVGLSFERLSSWQLIFGAVIFYPVCEEIIFRRFIQAELLQKKTMEKSYAGISGANFITSLLFALSHLLVFRELDVLPVFFPSLIFGYFYERYRNLGFPIALHAWYNCLGMLIPITV